MTQLIINADDLGIAPSIDEGIFKAHREGVVTSASVLVNSPRCRDVVRQAEAQGLPLGVHLNLTHGKSILPVRDIPLLVDDDGHFRLTSRELVRMAGLRQPEQELLRQVHAELDAQLAYAKATGGHFTHFDSHQHFHMIPALFSILQDIAPRHELSRTRLAAEPLTAFHLLHKPIASIARRNPLKWAWLRYAASHVRGRLTTPDNFWGVLHSGLMDAETLSALIKNLPSGTVNEIGLHPGVPCPKEQAQYPQPFANAFLMSPNRQRELDAATSPAVAARIHEQGIRLISFADFNDAGGTHGA